MNITLVFRVLSRLSLFLGFLLLIPSLVAVCYGDGGIRVTLAFLGAAAVAFALGILGRRCTRNEAGEFGAPEGFACVTLGWTFAALIGALPYLLSGAIPSFTDSFFEAMSGFTTTGASILQDVEVFPHGILFWRSFTQWLGGMGIVALFIALLPALGVGGNFLFQAEVPGFSNERVRPRISDSAKYLWLIYTALTGVLVLILWWLGMTPFEAVCHSMTTLSTGGFSTSNQSLGGFSASIQWVVTLFMFLAGVNFTMHVLLLSGRFRKVFENVEVRLYTVIVLLGTGLIVLSFYFLDAAVPPLVGESPDVAVPLGFHDKLRHAAFNTVSIVTTTGFGTHDFERWPNLCRVLLLLMMFTGGCAGSTAGGIKLARIWLLGKFAGREIYRLRHPSAVLPIKIGQRTVPENAVSGTAGFFILFVAIYTLGVLVLLAYDLDLDTSLSAAIACLSNIGPGLSTVGPVENYAHLPVGAKWFLSIGMLLGRLEIYSVMLLFVPSLWRR